MAASGIVSTTISPSNRPTLTGGLEAPETGKISFISLLGICVNHGFVDRIALLMNS